MKEIQLTESAIPSEIVYALNEHHDLRWYAERANDFYRVVFYTIANILKGQKSKNNKKIGFILLDTDGNFKLGAILNYHEPENGEDNDEDLKGNYTLEFTFEQKDLEGCNVLIDNHSDTFIHAAGYWIDTIMHGRFLNLETCNILFCEHIDAITKYLDANAIDNDEFSVVLQGIFIATVSVENDKKIITIVPGEMIKQHIKGDDAL